MAPERRTLTVYVTAAIVLVAGARLFSAGRVRPRDARRRLTRDRRRDGAGAIDGDYRGARRASTGAERRAAEAERRVAGSVPLQAEADAAAAAVRAEAPRRRPAPTGPPTPAPPPPIALRFIGFVEKNGKKLAMLSDSMGRPESGGEGDIIQGRYRILKIGVESVEVCVPRRHRTADDTAGQLTERVCDETATKLGLLLAATVLAGFLHGGDSLPPRRRRDARRRLDQAVTQYRTAVQASPNNANYKIALERAMQAASRSHLDKAKDYEDKDQLEAALSEYKLATEYEPSNRLAARQGSGARSHDSRARRSRAAQAADRGAARAGPGLEPRTVPESGIAGADHSARQLQQPEGNPHQPLEHHRDQHPLRSRGHRSSCAGDARRRHARGGAQPDSEHEPAVVQDHQPARDSGVQRHDARSTCSTTIRSSRRCISPTRIRPTSSSS